MKHLITLAFLLAFSVSCISQTALPYYTSFESAADTAGWQEYRLGVTSVYQWYYFNGHLNHDYPVAGVGHTNDWMVSPPFDFTNGGIIDSLRFRGEGFGMPMNMDTVALYLIAGNQNPDMASSQVLLKLFSDSTYMNDDVWYGHHNIVIPPTSGTSYLAFRYQTESNWLDVSVDDLSVSGNPVGIEDLKRQSVDLYPNPASDFLHISLPEISQTTLVRLYNADGRLVMSDQLTGSSMDVSSLPAGVYLIEVDDQHRTYTERVIFY